MLELFYILEQTSTLASLSHVLYILGFSLLPTFSIRMDLDDSLQHKNVIGLRVEKKETHQTFTLINFYQKPQSQSSGRDLLVKESK